MKFIKHMEIPATNTLWWKYSAHYSMLNKKKEVNRSSFSDSVSVNQKYITSTTSMFFRKFARIILTTPMPFVLYIVNNFVISIFN